MVLHLLNCFGNLFVNLTGCLPHELPQHQVCVSFVRFEGALRNVLTVKYEYTD